MSGDAHRRSAPTTAFLCALPVDAFEEIFQHLATVWSPRGTFSAPPLIALQRIGAFAEASRSAWPVARDSPIVVRLWAKLAVEELFCIRIPSSLRRSFGSAAVTLDRMTISVCSADGDTDWLVGCSPLDRLQTVQETLAAAGIQPVAEQCFKRLPSLKPLVKRGSCDATLHDLGLRNGDELLLEGVSGVPGVPVLGSRTLPSLQLPVDANLVSRTLAAAEGGYVDFRYPSEVARGGGRAAGWKWTHVSIALKRGAAPLPPNILLDAAAAPSKARGGINGPSLTRWRAVALFLRLVRLAVEFESRRSRVASHQKWSDEWAQMQALGHEVGTITRALTALPVFTSLFVCAKREAALSAMDALPDDHAEKEDDDSGEGSDGSSDASEWDEDVEEEEEE